MAAAAAAASDEGGGSWPSLPSLQLLRRAAASRVHRQQQGRGGGLQRLGLPRREQGREGALGRLGGVGAPSTTQGACEVGSCSSCRHASQAIADGPHRDRSHFWAAGRRPLRNALAAVQAHKGFARSVRQSHLTTCAHSNASAVRGGWSPAAAQSAGGSSGQAGAPAGRQEGDGARGKRCSRGSGGGRREQEAAVQGVLRWPAAGALPAACLPNLLFLTHTLSDTQNCIS